MQNKIGGKRPFITVNLRLTPGQHEQLKHQKGELTWEEYVLYLGGITHE